MFSQRVINPELLDHAPPDEARLVLADLVRMNHDFGGHSVMRKVLAKVVETNERFTLLDVGAASGDSARVIQRLYPFASVTSLDYSFVNLSAAPSPKVIGDAFQLPFSPASFDFIICSLFLHHFPNEQVVRLLNSFYSVARKALLVCDLERRLFPYCFLPVISLVLGCQRITLHDGLASVRASFRPVELLELSRMAGIGNARVEVHRPAFRISLVAAKS